MEFGGGVDLAAIASAAGLGGSAVSGIAALLLFKGFLARLFAQIVVTTGLTGVGFLVLLNSLGFEIVPRENPQAAAVAPSPGAESFQPESVQPEAAPAEQAAIEAGKKVYYVKSPFRS
jgi:hypothetical protein